MYNPIENDNYHEWIELYNPTNTSINLSGWTISDNYANDSIQPNTLQGNGSTLLPSKHYALITDQGTKLYKQIKVNRTLLLFVDDASIGNGLGNNNDCLILRNKTDHIIDAVEWGTDQNQVPGDPKQPVTEGYSLSRFFEKDTNDSHTDFYEAIIPTPGKKNNESRTGTIEINLYPQFIAKPYHFQTFGFPIAIQVAFHDFEYVPSFDLKAFISGENSSQPASQTWNGNKWQYSDRYTHIIESNQHHHFSHWFYLRLNKEYKAYQDHIKENRSGFIQVKIRINNKSKTITQPVLFLDMDTSTANATTGGYIVDQFIQNQTPYENNIMLIEDKKGKITGMYRTETNEIDESYINLPGYVKLASPVGTNYTLKVIDQHQSSIYTISNQTIRSGYYDVDLSAVKRNCFFDKRKTETYTVHIHNTGTFTDIYHLHVADVTNAWNVDLNPEQVTLSKGKTAEIKVMITPSPFEKQSFSTTEIIIKAASEQDPGLYDQLTLYGELIDPDLSIPNIKSYDEQRRENNIVSEGASIRIKAYCKNSGNENATDVIVSFYLDEINESCLLGTKYYDTIAQYQKYPSFLWDTHHVEPGEHTIWVVVDAADTIAELDESNNKRSYSITVLDTSPCKKEKKILITELYACTHSGIANEYFCIHNPNNQSIDISGWYLTSTPFKPRLDQQQLIFPEHTIIKPNCSYTITQNATAYHFETGNWPDFEYQTNSNNSIPQMICEKTIYFSNKGDTITLKDPFNHTIDGVHYGNTSLQVLFWDAEPIPIPKTSEILIRKRNAQAYVDTNRSSDWTHPRIYRIGQSRFPVNHIFCTGEITTFVSPDCSYQCILEELRGAEEHIHLNMYEISHPDLCQALIDALKRNVSVTLFLEGSPIGGISHEQQLILHRLCTYGADIYCIKNDVEKNIYARYTFDHAKYIILDHKTTIIESCNWVHTGIPTHPSFGNREWGIIIQDVQVASYFHTVFSHDCNADRADIISFQSLNLTLPPTTFTRNYRYYGSYEPFFSTQTFNESCVVTPVLSPDNSRELIYSLLNSAEHSIFVEQLYIYKNWEDHLNPFVEALIKKSKQGVHVKVIMNYNPFYDSTIVKCNETKTYLESHGIEVKYIYSNWSIFTNVHNKGVVIDNQSVLISSINWNENSVMNNRETGIIIHQPDIAEYYAKVFLSDWNLTEQAQSDTPYEETAKNDHNNNTIYILSIFSMTFVLIARDWRKRRWT